MRTYLIIMIAIALLSTMTISAQVYVGDIDLNTTVKSFELHVAKAGFSNKDRLYIDYGQKFREFDYDVENGTYGQSQGVYDSAKVKFKKGEYLRLINYLDSQGWQQVSQRTISPPAFSDSKSIITAYLFKRK